MADRALVVYLALVYCTAAGEPRYPSGGAADSKGWYVLHLEGELNREEQLDQSPPPPPPYRHLGDEGEDKLLTQASCSNQINRST
jgi:hypothetical protein